MPIDGMSGRVRIPRTVKIRLGYKPRGKEYPKDTDVFVGKPEDGVTKEILEAYDAKPIQEAEGETWSLGKSLRMLSYFEWDALSPQDNRELVVELMNRAWSHSKNRCFGDGGDQPGTASAADEEWAKVIQKVTHKAPVKKDDGRFQVVCLGPKCPFWSSNLATNKLATCHRELRLRARLLHPETNPEKPNYLKQLGWVEIASGSFNGMIDIQSGLQIMRSVAGRSAGIPFFLKRAPRTVLSDGKRMNKATLLVDYDHDEAIRFGFSDPKLVLVRPESRKQLEAMKREQLMLASLGVEFDSVSDIVPRLEGARPQLTDGSPFGEVGKSEAITADRDEVVQTAVDTLNEPAETDTTLNSHQLSPAELNRHLTADERNEIKVLCGGTPGVPASLERARELGRQACANFGDEYVDLSSLKVRHALWIKDALAQEKQAEPTTSGDTAAPTSPTEPATGNGGTDGSASGQSAVPASPEPLQQELIS